jgi:putative transposase
MAIHGREQKRDIRFKVANVIASTTKKLNAVVILEKLPKRCPRNMIKGVKVPSLKHRIPQAGFRGMVKRLKGSALKEAFPIGKVDPKGASPKRPLCGSKLIKWLCPEAIEVLEM